jgi:hypothetical protein
LRRAQELIRHTIPNADPAAIFDRALTLLVTELEKAKFAATIRPRAARETAAGSRHIPAAVKREVWTRDGGRCAFVGTQGRCAERGFLEFHHVVPYADGGQASAGNLQLRCRAHNALEAERHFAPLLVRERGLSENAVWTEPLRSRRGAASGVVNSGREGMRGRGRVSDTSTRLRDSAIIQDSS